MKASELIKKLEEEIQKNGDKDLVFAANKHSYNGAQIVSGETSITLALFGKIS